MSSIMNLVLFPIRKILGLILTGVHHLTLPTPKQRDHSTQARVNAQTKMLALYHFEGCPFCLKVRREIHRLGLDIEMCDIKKQREFEEELVKGGGEYQVPCLKITSGEGQIQWMYESSVINQYLKSRFENAL